MATTLSRDRRGGPAVRQRLWTGPAIHNPGQRDPKQGEQVPAGPPAPGTTRASAMRECPTLARSRAREPLTWVRRGPGVGPGAAPGRR